MAGSTEEDALKDSREGTRKTNSCDSRGGTETPVSHPSFGRRLNLWAPFSLTDVAEKGDEGSGSLCPKGSSALGKQTQSPFLQGQGTRGTVKTCRHRVSARWSLSWPPGREGNSSAGPAAVSTVYPPRGSPIHSAPWDVNPRPECHASLDGVELRVAEDRRWSGQAGWTRGKQNESEGMRRFGSTPVSGNPASRSPRDIGTRGHRTWTSALVHTCQPGNR